MKLSEIVLDSNVQNAGGVDLETLTGWVKIGVINGHSIYETSIGKLHIFSLDNMTFVMGSLFSPSVGKSKGIVIERSFTLPSHRNQGLSTRLYTALIQLGFMLVSDGQLSPGSYRVWTALSRLTSVNAYNIKTHELIRLNPGDLQNAIGYPEVRLLAEGFPR